MKIHVRLLLFHTQGSSLTDVLHENYYRQYGDCGTWILGRAVGDHLLSSSTIMTSLWKFCTEIWQQTMSRLPSGNHNKSSLWKWSEGGSSNNVVLWTDRLPSVLIFSTKRKNHSVPNCIILCVHVFYGTSDKHFILSPLSLVHSVSPWNRKKL